MKPPLFTYSILGKAQGSPQSLSEAGHAIRAPTRSTAHDNSSHGSLDARVLTGVAKGDPKLIRIMTADGPAVTTITVDGHLAGDCIQEVETSCGEARSKGKSVWLYLRNVTVISDDGQALLRRLATNGVLLKASGIYTSYIVESIQTGDSLRPDHE